MLDAIYCADWEERYYSFNQHWSADEQMASMRNGQGDEYFMLFTGGGCIFKTFAHEHAARNRVWTPQLSQLPALAPVIYREFFQEPAFSMANITSVGWYDPERRQWLMAEPDSETQAHLDPLLTLMHADQPAWAYADWAAEYFEVEADVEEIFNLAPLTQALLYRISETDLADVRADAGEIGYPLAE